MKSTPAPTASNASMLPAAGRDHLQGPISASMLLVEYGDYECPFCGAAYPVVKAVQKELGDRLCFAFRNFPLTNLHPHARHAAEAAEAAAFQQHFWAMHDTLFENQDQLEDEDISGYAAALHLDVSRLMSEVAAGAHAARVREDFLSGTRGGVNGTPTFFINGVRYSGAPTVSGLITALLGRHAG
jgi:protein-disulfide isomerase